MAKDAMKPQHPADHLRAIHQRVLSLSELLKMPDAKKRQTYRWRHERAALQWALDQLSGKTAPEKT